MDYSPSRTLNNSKEGCRSLGVCRQKTRKAGRDQVLMRPSLCPELCAQGSRPVKSPFHSLWKAAGQLVKLRIGGGSRMQSIRERLKVSFSKLLCLPQLYGENPSTGIS